MTIERAIVYLADKAQSARFIETAQKVGAARESTAAGDEVMARLVKQPPEPRKGDKTG